MGFGGGPHKKNGFKGGATPKKIKKKGGSGENLWSFHKLMRNSPTIFTKQIIC